MSPVRGVTLNSLRQRTVLGLLLRVLGLGAATAAAALLARALGPAGLGVFSFALALVRLAVNVGDFGAGQIATREIARAREDPAQTAGALVAVRALVGIVALIGTGLYILLAVDDPVSRGAALVVALSIPLASVAGLGPIAQGRLRPEVAQLLTVVQPVAWLIVVVILSRREGALGAFAMGYVAVAALQAVMGILMVHRLVGVSFGSVITRARQLLRQSWILGLTGVFVTTYYRFDSIALFQIRGADATGYYGAAYRLLDVLQILPSALAGPLLPLIASRLQGREWSQDVQRWVDRLVIVLFAFAVPVVVGGALLAPKVITLLYGDSFGPSVTLLRILLPAFLSITLGHVVTGVVVATDRIKLLAKTAAAATVLNIAAVLVMVPRFGAVGAAAVTLATEFGVVTVLGVSLYRHVGFGIPFADIVKQVAAALIMGLCLLPLLGWGLWVTIPVGASVYAGAVILLGGVRPEHIALIRRKREVPL